MKIFFVILSCCISLPVFAQRDGKIELKKDFWGYKFYQNELPMSLREVSLRMRENQAAYEEINKARANYGASGVLGFVGGFMIGWPIGQALGGRTTPQWSLAAGGAAVLIGAYSF